MNKLNRRRLAGFDPFFAHPFELVSDGYAPVMRPVEGLLKTDLEESETGFVFRIETPGIKKDGIEIEFDNGYLIVTDTNAQATEEDADGEKKFVCKERNCGIKKRSYYLGEEIDEDAITAKYEHGLLIIDVPKRLVSAPERKKFIKID